MKTSERLFFLFSGFTVFLGSLVLSLPAFSQNYRDDAVYVILRETTEIPARYENRETVPVKKLGLRIALKKPQRYGLHKEAFSMRLFDNRMLGRTFRIQFDSTGKFEEIFLSLEKDPKVEKVERIPIPTIQTGTFSSVPEK